RRECDGARTRPRGGAQALPVAGGECVRAVLALGVDRAHRVDDPARGHVPGRRHDRLPRGQPVRPARLPQPAAFRKDLRPSRAVDRTVDSPTAQQAGIRGIHDRVDVLLRDVTGSDREFHDPTIRGGAGPRERSEATQATARAVRMCASTAVTRVTSSAGPSTSGRRTAAVGMIARASSATFAWIAPWEVRVIASVTGTRSVWMARAVTRSPEVIARMSCAL